MSLKFCLLIFIALLPTAYSQSPPIYWKTCDTTLTYYEVFNPITGRTWLDRNLGAFEVADSSDDYMAYGSLYQWGRSSDGHECINWISSNEGEPVNGKTNELSDTIKPQHGMFIYSNDTGNWLSRRVKNLWDGVDAPNNPCPPGFRVPTDREINFERLSWSTNNGDGAFNSPLKFPEAGFRYGDFGNISSTGGSGAYWSDTTLLGSGRMITFNGAARMAYNRFAFGHCVRCIKDKITSVNETSIINDINIFPNPTSGIFSIILSSKNYKVNLYNSMGQEFSLIENKNSLYDISHFPTGIYFILIEINKIRTVRQIIKI